MDGWMEDGRMDGWMDGWIGGWMDRGKGGTFVHLQPPDKTTRWQHCSRNCSCKSFFLRLVDANYELYTVTNYNFCKICCHLVVMVFFGEYL